MGIDKSLLKTLHSKGLSDRKIATKVGKGYRTVGYHRKKLGLKSKRIKGLHAKSFVRNLDDVGCAYLAGLIDGEGYLGIVRSLDKRRQKAILYNPRISIGMNDKMTLEKVESVIGLNKKIYTNKHKRNGGWKTTFTLNICRMADIVKLLEQLYPFLITKKKQAKCLMGFCESRIRRACEPYSHTEVNYYVKLRQLNRRGKI